MLNEIKDCKYITSIGMMLSLDDPKIISYDADGAKYDFDNILDGKDGCTVYIKFQYLKYFLHSIFPHLKYKFVLVTGDGDETLPNDFYDLHTFMEFLDSDKILHWYSANCIEHLHPKLTLMPIGVNFHSLTFGKFGHWGDIASTPLQQENDIVEIKEKSLPFYEREHKCYSNFHFATYNEFGNPRKAAIEKIPKDLVFYEPVLINRIQTWINQSKYTFVISPIGHGLDCHRTWEALILGCVVVVLSSPLDSLYEELPVLILKDWTELTQELMDKTIEDFKNKDFNYDKITAKYWIEKIKKIEK